MKRLLSSYLRPRTAWLFDPNEPSGGNPADPPAGDPPTDPPADPANPPAADPPATVSMTQAELDKLIARSHAKGASAAEKKIGDYLAAETLTGEQKVAAERDAAIARADAAAKEALTSKVEVAAERLALKLKVDPARVDRFVRLLDVAVDDVTNDGKVVVDDLEALVKKALADWPEFAGGQPAPTGASGSEFPPTGTGKIWTRAEVAKLTPTEFEKNEAEIMAQTAQGLVK